MATRYVETSLDDFKSLLQAEKGWVLDSSGKEYVFKYRIRSQPVLLVKVFSGVHVNTDVGRECGKDAIRILCVRTFRPDTEDGYGWISTQRAYRTKNWRDSVKEKVTDTITQALGRMIDGRK